MFITFEGVDGAGKTTQLRRAAQWLREQGHDVVATREPGGTAGADEIRKLLVEGEPGRWSSATELLLFNAARRDHVERVIRPALERGAIVLCDRYVDSTRAYQAATPKAEDKPGGDLAGTDKDGSGRNGVTRDAVDRLHAEFIGLDPDATFIFDIDPEIAMARLAGVPGMERRFERLGLEFQRRLRGAYQWIAREDAARCHIVNADQSPHELARTIRMLLERSLKNLRQ